MFRLIQTADIAEAVDVCIQYYSQEKLAGHPLHYDRKAMAALLEQSLIKPDRLTLVVEDERIIGVVSLIIHHDQKYLQTVLGLICTADFDRYGEILMGYLTLNYPGYDFYIDYSSSEDIAFDFCVNHGFELLKEKRTADRRSRLPGFVPMAGNQQFCFPLLAHHLLIVRTYKAVEQMLARLDFNQIFPGFRAYPFALYDQFTAVREQGIFNTPETFLANTCVEYQKRWIAIWNMEFSEHRHFRDLCADMVHEMFHVHQKYSQEKRFPDEWENFRYSHDAAGFELKSREAACFEQILDAPHMTEKMAGMEQLLAIRNYRYSRRASLFMCRSVPACIQ